MNTRVIAGLVLLALTACRLPTPALAQLDAYAGPAVATEIREGGLEVHDYLAGEGPAAELDDLVEVHYLLTLLDGTEIDSSHDRSHGLMLVLGETSVIPGFAAGLVGVRRGMLRKLVVPPALGYGAREHDGIPANSTLVFHLQIMAVGGL